MRYLRSRLPFQEAAGVISKDPCWVWFANGRIFTGSSLCELALDVLTGWNDDRWLVG
jgi:hypothetical protein